MQPAGTSDLLARFLGDNAATADLIEWAVRTLVDGYDTPAVRDLAGLDLNPSADVRWADASALFRQSLVELEIPMPPREQALREHLRALAAQIVSGEIEPLAGADRIAHEVYSPLQYPSELANLDMLLGGVDPMGPYREVEGEERDALIVEEARRLLSPASTAQKQQRDRGLFARLRSMLYSPWSRE